MRHSGEVEVEQHIITGLSPSRQGRSVRSTLCATARDRSLPDHEQRKRGKEQAPHHHYIDGKGLPQITVTLQARPH